MTTPELNLLLTNDDGIDAPGIAALGRALAGLGRVEWIAPLHHHSGCGHTVTTHRVLEVHERSSGLAVDGTPADCVRLGLHHLLPKVDWVISGINEGGNLGVDVFISGTVAAVREGVIHGIPGIAVSHYIARGRQIDWERAAQWARRAIEPLLQLGWQPGTFWNINLPHPESGGHEPEIVFCSTDPSPLPLNFQVEGSKAKYSGDYQTRARRIGHDVDVCFGGQIAVSLVRLLDSSGVGLAERETSRA